MIVTFNDVKQDKMIINVSFKDSIEKIIIDAVVICKDVIYQSTGTCEMSPMEFLASQGALRTLYNTASNVLCCFIKKITKIKLWICNPVHYLIWM